MLGTTDAVLWEQARGQAAGTWASCQGCPQLAVWPKGSALAEGSEAPSLCPLLCHRDGEVEGSTVVTMEALGAHFLRSKPPSPLPGIRASF